MKLGRIVQVLSQRWYVFVSGMLVSVALGYGALILVPPVYQAQGTILLMPSQEQLRAAVRNPFLQLGSLEGPAGIVIARLSGDAARIQIEAKAPTAEYLVEPDPAMRGPGVLVTVTDRTPDAALDTLDFVLDLVTDTLAAVQVEQNVPQTAVVGSMKLVVDIEAERVTTATVRAVVAVLGVGMLATVALAIGLDSLPLRRTNSRRRPGTDPGAGDDGGSVAAPTLLTNTPTRARRRPPRKSPSGHQDAEATRVPPRDEPKAAEVDGDEAEERDRDQRAEPSETETPDWPVPDAYDEDDEAAAVSNPAGRAS